MDSNGSGWGPMVGCSEILGSCGFFFVSHANNWVQMRKVFHAVRILYGHSIMYRIQEFQTQRIPLIQNSWHFGSWK